MDICAFQVLNPHQWSCGVKCYFYLHNCIVKNHVFFFKEITHLLTFMWLYCDFASSSWFMSLIVYTILYFPILKKNLWFNIYRISNEFSFHTMYYETSCVFYIPEPLARGYKTHNEFHNTSYGMKIHLRFFLSHKLTRNEQIRRWNGLFPRIGDGWRRGLLRFDNKFALCRVINTRKFTKFEIKKYQEEHVLM